MAWSIETGEWERAEDENWDRDNCGLRYRVFVQMVHLHLFYLFWPNGAFHTFCFLLFCFVFFCFWILTWIGRFSTSICGCGRYRPIRHESAWISPIQRKSAWVCAVLAWVVKPKKKKKLDAALTCRQQRPSCVALSGCIGCGCNGHFASFVHPRTLVEMEKDYHFLVS